MVNRFLLTLEWFRGPCNRDRITPDSIRYSSVQLGLNCNNLARKILLKPYVVGLEVLRVKYTFDAHGHVSHSKFKNEFCTMNEVLHCL